MAVLVHCKCGKQFRTSGRYVGKMVRCPLCGGIVSVPADAPEAPEVGEKSAANALAALAGAPGSPTPTAPAGPTAGKPPAQQPPPPQQSRRARRRERRQAATGSLPPPLPPGPPPTQAPPAVQQTSTPPAAAGSPSPLAELAAQTTDFETPPPPPPPELIAAAPQPAAPTRPPEPAPVQQTPPAPHATAEPTPATTAAAAAAAPRPPGRPTGPRPVRVGVRLAMFCGLAMLVTLLVPWQMEAAPKPRPSAEQTYRVVMAWDLLLRGTPLAPWMVFCWLVGAAAMAAAPIVPDRRVRGAVLAGMGMVVTVFTITVLAMLAELKLAGRPVLAAMLGDSAAGSAFQWLAVTVMLAAAHLQVRFPRKPAGRWIAAAAAVAVAVLAVLGLVGNLAALAKGAPESRPESRWLLTADIVALLGHFLLLAAAAVHGAGVFVGRKPRLTYVGMALAYLGVGVPAVGLLGLSLTYPGGAIGMCALSSLNILLLAGAGLFLLGGGGLTLGTSLLSRMKEAAIGQEADAVERLRRMKALRAEDLITEEEYKRKRQQLVDEL